MSESIQKLLGEVDVEGFKWQGGGRHPFSEGAYAVGKVLCARHHDKLDGLDGVAASYFRTLLFIANPDHIMSGRKSTVADVSRVIDGRALEKWFLKFICGAVATDSIPGDSPSIPEQWIKVLFGKEPWPQEFAMYVFSGTHNITEADARILMSFIWSNERRLLGLEVNSFGITTLFALVRPTALSPNALMRPWGAIVDVNRPDGAPALEGMNEDRIHVQFRW